MFIKDRLKSEIGGRKLVGAIGIKELVAMKKLNTQFSYVCGAKEAAIKAD
ncbi:MAG TPA: hypothetical protein G4N93_00125 [Dehalococcoidia bacterium]|nr:hypothetical protein [Dehalococcoidia bacterium]